MAETIPAMRGQLGSTEYFIVVMKAKAVAEKMKAAVEIEGWEDLSLEQKYQREINLNRVRRQIAPYLAENEDRFFGALIVAAQNSTRMRYESVKEVAQGKKLFTGSHDAASDNLGFLTLTGAEILIPIDGQHRAKALDFAIRGRDDRNQTLDFRANTNLAREDVTLLLIRFDTDADQSRARRIFSRVNRYAKRPSKAEELIIDDEDIAAVFARRITERETGLLSGDLVQLRGNTLTDRAGEFTTLATVHAINQDVLLKKGHAYNASERPSVPTEKLYWKECEGFWTAFLTEIDHFASALKDPTKGGIPVRRSIRKEFLLGKPVGQRVLASALLDLTEIGRLSEAEACNRLNAVDWKISNPIWENILTRDATRVLSGVGAIKLGRDFVTYLVGRPLDSSETDALRQRISPDNLSYRLPKRVCAEIVDWGESK